MVQLVLLTSLAGDSTSIASHTLINTDEPTAKKLLDNKFARKLQKHEPTDEQLSKAVDFVDTSSNPEADEFDGEDSAGDNANDGDSDGDPDGDAPKPSRRKRSRPADAS
jgi:hypothetical protein